MHHVGWQPPIKLKKKKVSARPHSKKSLSSRRGVYNALYNFYRKLSATCLYSVVSLHCLLETTFFKYVFVSCEVIFRVLCESLALAKMVVCRFCNRYFASLKCYVLHCRIHRNEPRCVFKCESAGCKQTFCTYSAFKGHFYRKHNAPTHSVLSDCGTSAIIANFACAVPLCARQF